MKPVFCKTCKYLKFWMGEYYCNTNPPLVRFWYEERKEYANPKEKNMHNDCKDWEKK